MKKFAMVFPGQGSQAVGMLADLANEYPVVTETFKQASEALGYDLWNLVQQGPAEELNKNLANSAGIISGIRCDLRVWKEKYPQLQPSVMAGHSLGEYSALVCAGVIDFKDAIKLVELRGKLMQQAVPEGTGAMYAIIGLDNDAIINACKQAEQGGSGICGKL